MFAHQQRYFKWLLCGLLATCLLVVSGCGDSEDPQAGPPGERTSTTDSDAEGSDADEGESTDPDPDRPDSDTDGADSEAVAVIEEWSQTLAEGDVEGAAELFALPSIAENGTVVLRIETLEDAIAFNETLPCGAILQEAQTTGRFTTATFELTERPGGACGSGIGGVAATSFVITDGKIAEWRRVATDEERGGAPRGRET